MRYSDETPLLLIGSLSMIRLDDVVYLKPTHTRIWDKALGAEGVFSSLRTVATPRS